MPDMTSPYQQTITAIKTLLGSKGWRDVADAAAYYTDPRGRFTGRGYCVALPETTAEVAEVVKLCQQSQTPLVPSAIQSPSSSHSEPFK